VNLSIAPTNSEGMREFGICIVIRVKASGTESEAVAVPAETQVNPQEATLAIRK